MLQMPSVLYNSLNEHKLKANAVHPDFALFPAGIRRVFLLGVLLARHVPVCFQAFAVRSKVCLLALLFPEG